MHKVYVPALGAQTVVSGLEEIQGCLSVTREGDYWSVHVDDTDAFLEHCTQSAPQHRKYPLVVLLSGQMRGSATLLNEKQIARECEASGAQLLYAGEQEIRRFVSQLHRAETVLILGDAEAHWARYCNAEANIFCVSQAAQSTIESYSRRVSLLPTEEVGFTLSILAVDTLREVIPGYEPLSPTPRILRSQDQNQLSQDGTHELVLARYEHGGESLPIQALFEPNPGSKTLIVCFHGGLEPGPLRLPHYEWRGTLAEVADNKLYISDPTLWLSHALKNGWYFGTVADDITLGIKELIAYVSDQLGIEDIILVGSSAGGVAALQLGAHFSRAVALGYSLQRDMSKGPKIHTVGFYEHVLQGMDWAEAYAKVGSRLAVRDLFEEGSTYRGQAVWLQNLGDAEHMKDHYLPELASHGQSPVKGLQEIAEDKLTGYLTYWGEGHPIPPRSLFLGALEAAKKSLKQGSPFELTWDKNIKIPSLQLPVDRNLARPILHQASHYARPLKSGFISFKGRAPLGTAVAIQIGDKYYQATKVDSDGEWSLDVSFAKTPSWQVQLKTYDYEEQRVSHALRLVVNTTAESSEVAVSEPTGRESHHSLDELGVLHQTDSSSLVHNYLVEYEKIFKDLKEDPLLVTLIGVAHPGLLKTLLDYFTHAEFLAIETDEETTQGFDGRVSCVHPTAYSPEFFKKIAGQFNPGIVIDDGTHRWDHQMRAFEHLFIALKPGGYYIIEDIHTSFGVFKKNYQGGERESAYHQILSYVTDFVGGNQSATPESGFDFYFRESVASVKFLKHAVIIQKSDNPARLFPVRSMRDVSSSFDLHESGSYHRIPGTVVGGAPHIQHSFAALSSPKEPVSMGPLASGYLKEATMIGGGVVCTSDGYLVAETMNCARKLDSFRGVYRLEEDRLWTGRELAPDHYVEAVPGRQHVLLQSVWDANYGHWLWDTLSRIQLVKEAKLPGDPIWVINEPREAMRSIVYDTLLLAGIHPEDVMEHDNSTGQFESVYIPAALTVHPIIKSPEALGFLTQLVDKVPAGVHRKIYISRNEYGRRSLINEDEIWPLLKQGGFVKIIPEQLSFAEQASLFKGAHVVVGNLGAAFSSLAFSPDGVKVLALTTPSMRHDFFYDIVCHKKGLYYALQGNSAETTADMASSFSIDPQKLELALQEILSE
ncbi:hypothetical protein A7979_03750 [Rothia nasimurium]|uniref:Glycosyltransferase 61 catalytic domain-containing protein n=1 Tax=Rothia nasimurium TaxID=85336 RepID=A0A1Y1RNL8_9MICC|nr:glycosyltransferase 61 family protein [Rothia nasimurium]ORC16446.1 hypothetical protein A7979_03750 [Rothia nasimurium]